MTRKKLVSKIANKEVSTLSLEQRGSLLLDWWGLDAEQPEWEQLPAELQGELQMEEATGDAQDSKYDPLLAIGLAHKYRGMKNDYLLRRARTLEIEVEGVHGEPELLEACPCCLFRTLDERGGYAICPVCRWEDDGLRRLDGYSHPNGITLREGRMNFASLGACAPRDAGPNREDLREAYLRSERDVVE